MEKELSCNNKDHVNLKQDLSDNFGIVHLNLESYNYPLRCVYLFEETDEVVISQLEFKSAGRHISNFDWDSENKFYFNPRTTGLLPTDSKLLAYGEEIVVLYFI